MLRTAWDDVRQVRESDKILALLESETGRLQNLIHRYINQPSPDLFAEILLLREAVLGTLTSRAANDPMLSGSVEELERVTDRFLSGLHGGGRLFSLLKQNPDLVGLVVRTLGIAPMWFLGRDGDRLAASCAAGVRLGSSTYIVVQLTSPTKQTSYRTVVVPAGYL